MGGVAEHGVPAVVAIVRDGSLFCSGTLIAPRLVLTAGHCALFTAAGINVSFGDSIVGGMQIPATAAAVDPALDLSDPQNPKNDVGVFFLASDAPVAPQPLSVGAPVVGDTLRFVGFGTTGDDGGVSDIKRSVDLSVSKVGTNWVVTQAAVGKSICSGDSGGAALLSNANTDGPPYRLGGIIQGAPPTCDGISVATRIDANLPFIRKQLDAVDDHQYDQAPGCGLLGGRPTSFFSSLFLLSLFSVITCRRRKRIFVPREK